MLPARAAQLLWDLTRFKSHHEVSLLHWVKRQAKKFQKIEEKRKKAQIFLLFSRFCDIRSNFLIPVLIDWLLLVAITDARYSLPLLEMPGWFNIGS